RICQSFDIRSAPAADLRVAGAGHELLQQPDERPPLLRVQPAGPGTLALVVLGERGEQAGTTGVREVQDDGAAVALVAAAGHEAVGLERLRQRRRGRAAAAGEPR